MPKLMCMKNTVIFLLLITCSTTVASSISSNTIPKFGYWSEVTVQYKIIPSRHNKLTTKREKPVMKQAEDSELLNQIINISYSGFIALAPALPWVILWS